MVVSEKTVVMLFREGYYVVSEKTAVARRGTKPGSVSPRFGVELGPSLSDETLRSSSNSRASLAGGFGRRTLFSFL